MVLKLNIMVISSFLVFESLFFTHSPFFFNPPKENSSITQSLVEIGSSQKIFSSQLYALEQTSEVTEVSLPHAGGANIFSRAVDSGPVVFFVLLVLILLSVVVWSILFAKWVYFRKINKAGNNFVDQFWESRSLNDLNAKINDYAYSPARELFKKGYAELARGNQLKGQYGASELLVQASLDNLHRALSKARFSERSQLEKFIPFLAIGASTSPFIGLFGTVWGIMRAFEGIAQTGNASLAAVAPGISEALIATAFGLAAAIPAAVGYNLFVVKIKQQMQQLDAFSSDFLNIVERYLVSENMKATQSLSGGGTNANKEMGIGKQ